jgi:thioredoxin-related protein
MKQIFSFIAVYSVMALTAVSFTTKEAHASKDQYVILYYGATSCHYCNLPENIRNINTLAKTIGQKFVGVKRVMVCMDKDLKEGLSFINKYDSAWDEISIGSFYQNELAFQYLNTTKIPGVPHVILLKRSYSDDNQYSVPVASRTDILADLVGGNAINKWILEGFPISRP